MKKNLIFIALLGLSLSWNACTPKINFSTDVRDRVSANNIPLQKLQYYVDREVQLKRVITTGESKASGGTFKIENGKQVHIITLKKGTPGVCTEIQADRIFVSFEEGAGKELIFGFPKFGTSANSYVLQVLEVDKNGWGRVNYNGKVYSVAPDGVKAKIKIKKSSATKVKVKKDTMKGRKVE